MARPQKLDSDAINAWLEAHPGWSLRDAGLERELRFGDYPSTIAFVTRLAFEAERRDHHPDLVVGYGRVTVRFTTHDAGGVTSLDLELCARVDELSA